MASYGDTGSVTLCAGRMRNSLPAFCSGINLDTLLDIADRCRNIIFFTGSGISATSGAQAAPAEDWPMGHLAFGGCTSVDTPCHAAR